MTMKSSKEQIAAAWFAKMKRHFICSLLFLGGLGITTAQIKAPLYPIDGTLSPVSDDGSFPLITFQKGFVFFGRKYYQIYVNQNGYLTFDRPWKSFIPQEFPLHGSKDIIAPFWTDLDNSKMGQVKYNQYTSGTILQQATDDVNRYFPLHKFVARWVFVATWYEVAYFPNVGKGTTVQVVLISDGQLSFVLMNYGKISHTIYNVQAGYDTINSSHYFTIPGSFSSKSSRTNANFHLSSNVKVPGRWAFQTNTKGCTVSGVPLQLCDSFWTDSTCTKKCTCTSSGLSCHFVPCAFSQVCVPDDFQFSCQSVQRGTCTISGDPHYKTFDGTWHHFQGTCTYVLSEQCGAQLPYYRVEGSNEHRGNTRVSWTRLVKVFVYNETIELVKGHRGEAKVNGQFAATPFFLNSGTVYVYESGFNVIVSTVFGLEVSYDTDHYVRVSVPYSYQKATCGLCGTFNDNPNDDFQTPQGELVSSDVFANSWQVAGADEPGCGVACRGLDCNNCSRDQKALFSNTDHCGILGSTSGPFAACHQLLPPEVFVESCVYDLCLEEGHTHILCQALSVYVSQCQQNGIRLPSWRKPGFCEIHCPANSHFESQGTGCPATCVNPDSTQNCPLPPQESCICNKGYILSGGVCVPPHECGCNFEGRYYRSGQAVILGEDCGRLCNCSSGSMTCHPYGCGPHESCMVEQGERGCRPASYHGTCSASGDPHYFTFDQKAYDFQGTCRYVLATLCNDTTGLHNFSVEAKNEALRGLTVSVTAEVYVNVRGFSILMSGHSSGVVKVNGITKNLPVLLNKGLVSVYASGLQTIVDSDFGLRVSFDGQSTVSISVPSSYSGKTCGLCGNFNGNPNDDLRTPSGLTVTSLSEFGTAWKVPGNYSCSDGCGSTCPQCPDDLDTRAQCEIIQAAEGPFSLCHQQVDPTPYFNDCAFDVCIGGEALLCVAIQAYVRICQSSNVQIYPWRDSTPCAIACPANSHYEVCGTDCGHTCASSVDATCERVCSEGCFCDEGFVRDGAKCVPTEKCGCQYEGFYYHAGESFWTDGCSQRCECHAPNDLSCVVSTCTSAQECTIKNGHLGCYDAVATCTVWGDPHYVTLDGAVAHFQGTCSYIITQSLIADMNEARFKVVATNNHRGNNVVSFVSAVDVYLSNEQEYAHLRIGLNKRVKINGTAVSPPVAVGTLAQVLSQESYIVVDANDLIIQYDGSSTLIVRLGNRWQNKVTGMCGNFNSDPADDKALPDGTLTQNDSEFGNSWKAATSQLGCGATDDPSPGPSDCLLKDKYSELCGVITDTSGPFSGCHQHSDPEPFFSSCVYDLCLYTEANNMLCAAVLAYEGTCTVLGLNISEWRTALQCGDPDPCRELNCTEYEWCGEREGIYGCSCHENFLQNSESYDASIACVSSSATVSLSRCQLFEAGFHPSDLHLRDDSCKASLHNGRLVFHFNNDDQLCGTILKSNGTHFMYENVIRGDKNINIHLIFSCVYPLISTLPMDVVLNPVESAIKKILPSGEGHYHVKITPYQDAFFQFPLRSHNNIEIELDEMLFMEVRTEDVDERQISTVLDTCWATPLNDASYPLRHELIMAKCPADSSVRVIQNGNSTVARFSFKIFSFNNFPSIYLHCQIHLCLLDNNCAVHCNGGKTRGKRDVSYHDSVVLSLGPLVPLAK